MQDNVTPSAGRVFSLEGVAAGGDGSWHIASPWSEPQPGRWPVPSPDTGLSGPVHPFSTTAWEEGLVTVVLPSSQTCAEGFPGWHGARHRLRPREACCQPCGSGGAPAVGCLWTGSWWSEQRVLLCLPCCVPHTSLGDLPHLLFPLRGFALSWHS